MWVMKFCAVPLAMVDFYVTEIDYWMRFGGSGRVPHWREQEKYEFRMMDNILTILRSAAAAIAGESRHVFKLRRTIKIMSDSYSSGYYYDVKRIQPKDLPPMLLKTYLSQPYHVTVTDDGTVYGIGEVRSGEGRLAFYSVVPDDIRDIAALMEDCEYIFNYEASGFNWSSNPDDSSFGGKKWMGCAVGAKELAYGLLNREPLPKLIIRTDHLVDLVHNNGKVLNKFNCARLTYRKKIRFRNFMGQFESKEEHRQLSVNAVLACKSGKKDIDWADGVKPGTINDLRLMSTAQCQGSKSECRFCISSKEYYDEKQKAQKEPKLWQIPGIDIPIPGEVDLVPVEAL